LLSVGIENAVRREPVRFVALDSQHARIETELLDVFRRVLRSSAFTLGSELEQFEEEFAAYCEVSHCVGVASGTAALRLTLQAYGIGRGHEVIVPAHTFIASALAVAHAGATLARPSWESSGLVA
jgi:dTDP-4-amino-4,6-dideoxygalactose transaminase